MKHLKPPVIALGLAGLVLWAAAAAAGPRLALVFDTSGSMADSDPHRYAVQFAKVMAQTLAGGVEIGAFYAPGADCRAVGEASGAVRFTPADPGTFDTALESGVRYRGGNVFGPPLAAARAFLGEPAAGSVLAILADGGGRSGTERRALYGAEIARRVTAAGGRHEDVDVRVSLLWNTQDDLDLYVVPPSGEKIWFGHMRSRCNGVLDVDRNAGTTTRQPVENIRWEKGRAPKGTYRVIVQNYAFREALPLPIDFVVEIVVGGEVRRHSGTVGQWLKTGPASDVAVAEFQFDPQQPATPPGPDPAAVASALGRADTALNPAADGCPDPAAELAGVKAAGAAALAITLGRTASPFADPRLTGESLRIGSQAELTATVAAIAARHFGRTRLMHGAGTGRVAVEVLPDIGELWLLVSADGDLAGLHPSPNNPRAAAVDTRAAVGSTASADGQVGISYRVVRIANPAAGTWRFATGNALALGWLAQTKGLLGLRLAGTPALLRGRESDLTLEVFDPITGKVPTDPELIASLKVDARLGGVEVAFADDGSGPDQGAGDGRFSARFNPAVGGTLLLKARLHYDAMQRELEVPLAVADAAWRFRPTLPATQRRDIPLLVAGSLEPIGAPGWDLPAAIAATSGDLMLLLRDDGQGGDRAAGDRIYSSDWTPSRSGILHLDFAGQGGAPLASAAATLAIVDWVELKGPAALDFGLLGSNQHGVVDLDLGASAVHGEAELELSVDLHDGLALTFEGEGGARPLAAGQPLKVRLADGTSRWPLRMSVPRCLPRLVSPVAGTLQIRVLSAAGAGQQLSIPIRVATAPLPWLRCLLPALIAAAALLLAAFLVWGFVSPARFPRRLGVILSPEEDLNEGFFQLIRSRKGTGSGFYRDARAYLSTDFRLSGSRVGALVCLIAGSPRPRLKPLAGQPILRRKPDGGWEPMGDVEGLIQFGVLYRGEAGTLYFEFRNT